MNSEVIARLFVNRYVQHGSGRSAYSLAVPSGSCGTKEKDGSQSNTLIFQSDPIIQEIWDVSRKIVCRKADKITKYVTWRPLMVDMLDVQGPDTEVDCWMDVFKGVYPNTRPIDGSLKIGEDLSLVIYLRDPNGGLDVAVRDCWAYDDHNIDDESTLRVQLTTADGCARKPKLMHFWRKSNRVSDGSGATLVAYSNVTAFRFPTKGDVFFTCNVDICEGSCHQRNCVGEESNIDVVTRPPVTTIRPPSTTVVVQSSTVSPVTEMTTTRPVTLPGASVTPGPTTSSSTPYRPNCSKDSQDPRCPTTRKPIVIPNCVLNPNDARCPQPSTPPLFSPLTGGPTTPASPVTPPTCRPGTKDPRCPTTAFVPIGVVTTTRPAATSRPTPPTQPALSPPDCQPGTKDPRCPTTVPTPITDGTIPPFAVGTTTTPGPTTRLPPFGTKTTTSPTRPTLVETTAGPSTLPAVTPSPQTPPPCWPGQNDPRCPSTTLRPATTSTPTLGSERPVITTFQPSVPSTARPPAVTTAAPSTVQTLPPCWPGTTDPRCPTSPTTGRPSVITVLPPASPATTQPPTVSSEATRPFSTGVTPTQGPSVTSPSAFDTTPTPSPQSEPSCFPGSSNPKCTTAAPPECSPGNPECPGAPSTTTQRPFECTPNSREPRCPPIFASSTTTTRTTTASEVEVPIRTTSSPGSKPSTTKPNEPGKPGWEGADPRYHAFHSWLYQPAPRPRGTRIKTAVSSLA